MAQRVKNPPAMWETWVLSLGGEDPLEKGKATHSRIKIITHTSQSVRAFKTGGRLGNLPGVSPSVVSESLRPHGL